MSRKFLNIHDSDIDAGKSSRSLIATLPIDIVGVGNDLTLATQAAIYKATHKMSCADRFGAALAKIKNVEFVTGDPEFKESKRKSKWSG